MEETSFWFAHRNRAITQIVRRFPPGGPIYDVGGGNGFVARALQNAGFETVLVEPGHGAINAKARGIIHIVQSTLEDAGFLPSSMDAVGAFDVLEHIERDGEFLATIMRLLRPGGRFYCTVPALQWLWSCEDEFAGHYRRYSLQTLRAAIESAGMRVVFISGFFSWLIPAVFLFRTLPRCILGPRKGRAGSGQALKADHTLPPALSIAAGAIHRWEIARLGKGRPLPFGSSLICVARSPMP